MSEARESLSFEELGDALAELVGERVSVRIVEGDDPKRLIAVLDGVLGARTNEKAPSHFWPIKDGLEPRSAAAERFGIVLHEDVFGWAEARAGGHVLVISQGSLVVNVRRL